MEEGAERGSSPTSKTYVARGCIKTTAGPWVVRRPSGKGASETVWRTPSAKERENNRRRERVRRSVAAKIFAGLRAHGNYRLPKHADHNEVLKALCNEAGWHVEEDGTIFRKNCTEMKRLIPLVAASPGVSPSSSSSHVGQHRETTTCSARSSRKTSNSSTFSCRESDSGRVTPEQTSPDAANGGTDVGFLNNICPSHAPVELETHQYTTSALKIMKGEDLKLSNITGTRQKVHQKRVCELGQPATNKEQVESSEGEEYCCLWPLSIEAAEVNRSSSDPKGKLKPIERPAEFHM